MNSLYLFRSYLMCSVAVRMCSSKKNYEDAVCKLNLLQSNKASIEQIRKEIRTGQVSNAVAEVQEKCTNLQDMERYLSRTGVTLQKLDELSVIHIAGTKGKGSTSAMCESILRRHGFRTGFYSSPHLVAVRERIRLNGQVISEDKFAHHFHQVHDKLDSTKAHEGDMPKYFSFLTVLAFNMFLDEKVDVALVEVGIGGVVDFTNVLRKVPVVGITALGLDHTSILGNTLPEIAAAKAGIMKPGCEAYTVSQPNDAMDVLRKFANSVKCPLTVVPDYKSYTFLNGDKVRLPVDLEAYQTNASLAIQLAHAWMRINKGVHRKNGFKKPTKNGLSELMQFHPVHNNDESEIVQSKPVVKNGKSEALEFEPVHENGISQTLKLEPLFKNGISEPVHIETLVKCVTKETMEGLTSCKWPGRYQVVKADHADFYLDGAHTKESMEICAQWFRDSNSSPDKTLVFSATGDRNAEILLQPLEKLGFNTVYFVIPTAFRYANQTNDNYSKVEDEELIARCQTHAEIWQEFQKDCHTNVIIAGCVADALVDIKKSKAVNKSAVLITGSLHLVGAALSILDPNVS